MNSVATDVQNINIQPVSGCPIYDKQANYGFTNGGQRYCNSHKYD